MALSMHGWSCVSWLRAAANHALTEESSLTAVSDLLLAGPDLVEQGMAAVLEVFAAIPLGAYMAIVNELRGRVHQGHALAGILTGASGRAR
ncbi:hypothetical protein [Mesorhizobium sp. M0520]|uniref:hypothetical protein n=1 Tax=Mesorhizobium sp. M0520 TaxID=2956957 RepID=UPI00333A0FC0